MSYSAIITSKNSDPNIWRVLENPGNHSDQNKAPNMIQNWFQEQLECWFTDLESGPIPILFSAPSQHSHISFMAQTFLGFCGLKLSQNLNLVKVPCMLLIETMFSGLNRQLRVDLTEELTSVEDVVWYHGSLRSHAKKIPCICCLMFDMHSFLYCQV